LKRISWRKQLLIISVSSVIFFVGRHVINGQVEWITPVTDEQVQEYIERTSSASGYYTLQVTLPGEAEAFRDEVVRQIKFERRRIVPNRTARHLFTEIRRRNAYLFASAPDDLNRQAIAYNRTWLEAVENDADMCERVFSLGDAGILNARVREFLDDEERDNSILFETMKAGQDASIERAPLTDDEWVSIYSSLFSEGFSREDFELLKVDNIQLPESCGAMARYFQFVESSSHPKAEQARAHLAKSLSEL